MRHTLQGFATGHAREMNRMPRKPVSWTATLAVLLLGLAGVWMARPASAQELPPGSYMQSCFNFQVIDGTLLANCRRMSGGIRPTSLPRAYHCHGDIANQDGRLICIEERPRVPGGSYLQSCSNAQVVDDTLFADCLRMNQTVHQTRLPYPWRCHGDIANEDGHLRCLGG
jgi:hypothetical protein